MDDEKYKELISGIREIVEAIEPLCRQAELEYTPLVNSLTKCLVFQLFIEERKQRAYFLSLNTSCNKTIASSFSFNILSYKAIFSS